MTLQATSSPDEVRQASIAAKAAWRTYAGKPTETRIGLLLDFAQRLEDADEDLLRITHRETSLPMARLKGEKARSVGQLRMFAKLLEEGSYVDARIDSLGQTSVDLRCTHTSLGPVAVFGASNFPYAFSIAGGDVASALAAGCSVIFKAHPGHPQTTEYISALIQSSLASVGLPKTVFQVVWGGVPEGADLVMQPEVAAVGFTGSLVAGRALFDLAARRPRPIPVYAEMGSVNPVFLLPQALRVRKDALADCYANSLTMGFGQFCTNPGVVAGIAGSDLDDFILQVTRHLGSVENQKMLTDTVESAYVRHVEELIRHKSLTCEFQPSGASPALFSTTFKEFLDDDFLATEVFGPCGIVVKCKSFAEIKRLAEALAGQLTMTVHYEQEDMPAVHELLPYLVEGCGRVVANGFPTGVEVLPAMQHGGPYPATTDSRSTSVGTGAIMRFLRPVAYQNFDQACLPEELTNPNPKGIMRTINGDLTREKLI